MDDQSFIPECYVDTNLIETLLPPTKQYNHQKGCGTVTKIMKEKFADRFAVGIIDKDKREVDYLKEFDILLDNESLLLHKHRLRHHYIIQVSPAMEKFIVRNAQAANLNLEDFGLSANLDLLKKEAKKVNTKSDQRFKGLFKSIFKKGAPDFLRLKNWLMYLKDKNYKADVNELRQL
jgi:hypothetical protein